MCDVWLDLPGECKTDRRVIMPIPGLPPMDKYPEFTVTSRFSILTIHLYFILLCTYLSRYNKIPPFQKTGDVSARSHDIFTKEGTHCVEVNQSQEFQSAPPHKLSLRERGQQSGVQLDCRMFLG